METDREKKKLLAVLRNKIVPVSNDPLQIAYELLPLGRIQGYKTARRTKW